MGTSAAQPRRSPRTSPWGAEVAGALDTGRPVAIDFGFPFPGGFPVARDFIAMGFELWWFDGDWTASWQSFVAREQKLALAGEPAHPATLDDFYRYMGQVATHRAESAKLYADRHLDVILPGPKHVPYAERFASIQVYPRG